MAGRPTRKSAVPNTDMKVKAGESTVQAAKAEVCAFIIRRHGLSVPSAPVIGLAIVTDWPEYSFA